MPKNNSRRALLKRMVGMSGAVLLTACTPAPASTPTATALPATRPAAVPTRAALSTPTAGLPAVPILDEKERALIAVTDLTMVARLVGNGAINDTSGRWGLNGADLGSLFDKGERLYMLFGDSFGCCIPGTGGPGDAKDWRSSCMAVIDERKPADGLTFAEMITDRPGHAKQLLPRGASDVTVIPTYGVAIGQRMFLHYMAVREWGAPGEWFLNESGLAYSDDDGQTWVKDEALRWEGKSGFGQVAFVKEKEDLYLFGIPGGRFGGVRLARVKQADILDKTAYTYFGGLEGTSPRWQPDEAQAAVIVPAPVGELSVMWNAYLGRWIMTYLNERQAALVIREARELWGPWSSEQTLVSAADYPGLYGAYLHPWLVENEGETIYFAMSQWGPYAVFLMKAMLEK